MVGASDEGDAAAAGIYQMLRGLEGSLVAIGGDGGEAVGETGAPEEDKGDAHVGYLLEMLVVGGVLRQTGDDALDMQADEIVDGLDLGIGILMRIGADDRIALLAGLILDAIEHGGIIMGDQIGHHHAYHPRGLLTQALRKRIGTIITALGQFLDLCLHVLPDLGTAAQGTADGGDADTQLLGQVFQRCAMFICCHFHKY